MTRGESLKMHGDFKEIQSDTLLGLGKNK